MLACLGNLCYDPRSRGHTQAIYLEGKIVIITLKRKSGQYAVLIDDCDFPLFQKRRWTINGRGYVLSVSHRESFMLHREITNCPPHLVVNHKNGNKLDNRRENLECVTQKVNMLKYYREEYTQ